ncbi:MAG: YbaK/EbsC family protein [archaeon]
MKELHIKLDFIKAAKREEKPVPAKIKKLLDSANSKYREMHHAAVFTSAESAKVRGTELKQGAKALIFKVDGKFVMAVISAAKKVDSKKLKKIISAKDMVLASADEVKKLTGLEIGSIPPFGELFGLQTYVDNTLGENEFIAFNAGSHTDSIVMKYDDYKKALNPIVEDFSEK